MIIQINTPISISITTISRITNGAYNPTIVTVYTCLTFNLEQVPRDPYDTNTCTATLLVLHVLLYYQLEVRTSELEEDVTHPRDRAH